MTVGLQLAAQLQPALVPDSVVRPPDGPEYTFLASDGAPLSAVRVSVLFREDPGERGAGALLRQLAEERVVPLARAAGVDFRALRTPWGLSYTASGPTADFERLGEVLRAALAPPSWDEVTLGRARRKLTAEVEGDYETPGGSISRLLRARISPEASAPLGTPGSLANLRAPALQGFWARTHARSHLRVVVASPVPAERAYAALWELGRIPDGTAATPPPVADELAPPATEVLRRWYGRAFLIPSADDPRAEVLALLLAEELNSTTNGFGYETGVELRQTASEKILIVTGAAYPDRQAAMRTRVSTVLRDVAGAIEEADVARISDRLVRSALLGAATPMGRVEFVGRHIDAAGSIDGAVIWIEALRSMTASTVAELAAQLVAAPPIELEIR